MPEYGESGFHHQYNLHYAYFMCCISAECIFSLHSIYQFHDLTFSYFLIFPDNVSIEEKVTASRKEVVLERPQNEKVRAVSEKKGDKLSEFRSSKPGRTSPADANIVPEASTRKRKQKSPATQVKINIWVLWSALFLVIFGMHNSFAAQVDNPNKQCMLTDATI